MKSFLLKIITLFAIVVGMILLLLWIIPPDANFKKSLFFSVIDKNELLKNTSSPRVIFIGGSNLSFGLDSKIIQDSLNVHPINTGVHACFGLKFMMKDVEPYVKKNDVIVLVPEYSQYFGDLADGRVELLSILVDVDPKLISTLDIKQIGKQMTYIQQLTTSKVNNFIFNRNDNEDTAIGVYDRKSFNKYGDGYMHWELQNVHFDAETITRPFNNNILKELQDFEHQINKKGAKLYISFPCYQDISYNNSIKKIKEVETILKENGFILISTPEEYKFHSDFFFNSPYHLNKKGVDRRTLRIIEDLRKMNL